MILPEAKREYLSRKLDDYSWVKDVPRGVLEEYLKTLNPVPYFRTIPYLQQLASFVIATALPEFLFLLDPGTGKTKLVLDALSWRWIRGEWNRGLVLVPNVQNIWTWVRNAHDSLPSESLSLDRVRSTSDGI